MTDDDNEEARQRVSQRGPRIFVRDESPGDLIRVETTMGALDEFQNNIQGAILSAVREISTAIGDSVKEAIQAGQAEIQSNMVGSVANPTRTGPTSGNHDRVSYSRGARPTDLGSNHVVRPRVGNPSRERVQVCRNGNSEMGLQPGRPSSSRRRVTRRESSSSSSSDASEMEIDQRTERSDAVESSVRNLTTSTRQVRATSHIKLPPFTGKEAWKVWYNRFDEVADRQGWDEGRRLDELLPKMQGPAGEFVFGQLTKQVRSNYHRLVQELKNRYRIVETAKTFGVQFSRRNQKPGESVEEYAADLKRLYDKAYARRDRNTRREDLLRRFLDGLLDDKASFQVEYVRNPEDIDQAVFEVVTFSAAKQHQTSKEPNYDAKRPKKVTRMVRADDSDSEEETCTKKAKTVKDTASETDSETDKNASEKAKKKGRKSKHRAARVPNKGSSEQKPSGKTGNGNGGKGKTANNTDKDGKPEENEQLKSAIELLTDSVLKIGERLNKLEDAGPTRRWGPPGYAGNGTTQGAQTQGVNQGQRRNPIVCYSCGTPGHISRECPNRNFRSGGNQFTPRQVANAMSSLSYLAPPTDGAPQQRSATSTQAPGTSGN